MNALRVWTAVFIGMLTLSACLPAYGAPADARHKRWNGRGAVPSGWNQPKPPITHHPDVPPKSAGSTGDGHNTIPFSQFDDGDMVVVLGTLLGHAGCWSDALYSPAQGLYSYCVWSANIKPVNGVQLERPIQYHGYDRAYGLWVPSRPDAGSGVIAFCARHRGEPYVITSRKLDFSRWYCSKLPWAGWFLRTGLDLDADRGYWVWPVDLLDSPLTAVFASSN